MSQDTLPNSTSRSPLVSALESKEFSRREFHDYKRFITNHYDGIAGNLTRFTGVVTGHGVLAGKLFRPSTFDLRGCKRILDAGCGNGRYTKYILRHSDDDALITAFDLSQSMLRRARRHLKSPRVTHVSADLTRLPYENGFFDAVVCGWVLEHLPDPRPGLGELSRVLNPGGKLLLMTTEDTVLGAFCSRMWHCRTYNRKELIGACEESGLSWVKPIYFTGLHKFLRLGGIVAELRKRA